jgi:hypothetical protein
LGGLYITDNLGNPIKFQIPTNNFELTTIPAKGFKLFWADGQPELGALHLGFRLDQNGEQIGLVQKMDYSYSFIDSVSFSRQKTDTSMGRYSDGAITWYSLLPTPAEPNQLLPVAPNMLTGTESITGLKIYPNPFRNNATISYTTFEKSKVILSVYDISGRKIKTLLTEEQPAGSYNVEWKAENINPGIYLCVLITGQYKEAIKMVLMK